jgi:dTDP-4-dehydrorhamnose 3,5-epimerase
MRLTPTAVAGAFIVEIEPRTDSRGSFARVFCARELATQGIALAPVQCNIAYTTRRGTIRGLHHQAPPSAESKLVRCTRGVIYDVLVDLRLGSPTFGRHVGVELSADNQRALYVPPQCAHGYQTLVDGCEVSYLVGDFYDASAEQGVRYDDPTLAIEWPLAVSVVSDKDAAWPLLPPTASLR